MVEVLEFIFQSLHHYIGFFILSVSLVAIVAEGIGNTIRTIRGPK